MTNPKTNFADVVLYLLSLFALAAMLAGLIACVHGLHDDDPVLCAKAAGCLLLAGILWVLTKIAERLEPAH